MFVEIFLSLVTIGPPDIINSPYSPPSSYKLVRTSEVLLLEAKEKTTNLEYEQSIQLLKQFQPNRSQYNEYNFLMMINYFALNDKTNAEKWAKNLRDSFEKLDRRHEALLFQVEEILPNWEEGDLNDIVRDMRISRDRLSTAKAGKDTQKIQKQIVDKLDKMINDEEDKIKKAIEAENAKNGIKLFPTVPTGDPAHESIIMGGVSGTGKIDEKVLRQVAEQWGNLPPAKRAKVVEDLTRDVPQKYKVQIEEYLKALNKIYK